MADLDQFTGREKVSLGRAEPRGELWLVRMQLVTQSHETVPVDYLMADHGDRWLAEDVSIQAVSLVNHYRQTFTRFLVNHSFRELLDRLGAQLPGRH